MRTDLPLTPAGQTEISEEQEKALIESSDAALAVGLSPGHMLRATGPYSASRVYFFLGPYKGDIRVGRRNTIVGAGLIATQICTGHSVLTHGVQVCR